VSDNIIPDHLQFLDDGSSNQRYPGSAAQRPHRPPSWLLDTAASHHQPDRLPRPADIWKQYQRMTSPPLHQPLDRILEVAPTRPTTALIPRPYGFAIDISSADITALLRILLFPGSVPLPKRLRLTPSDYTFLRHYLHATPTSPTPSTPRPLLRHTKYLYYGRNPKSPPTSASTTSVVARHKPLVHSLWAPSLRSSSSLGGSGSTGLRRRLPAVPGSVDTLSLVVDHLLWLTGPPSQPSPILRPKHPLKLPKIVLPHKSLIQTSAHQSCQLIGP
jgi:hypothetical protein